MSYFVVGRIEFSQISVVIPYRVDGPPHIHNGYTASWTLPSASGGRETISGNPSVRKTGHDSPETSRPVVIPFRGVPGYRDADEVDENLPGATASDIANWVLPPTTASSALAISGWRDIIINCPVARDRCTSARVNSADLNFIGNVGVFRAYQSCDIGTIWLVACGWPPNGGVATGGSGQTFCARLLQDSRCDVIASATTRAHLSGKIWFCLRRAPMGLHRRQLPSLTYHFKSAGGYPALVTMRWARRAPAIGGRFGPDLIPTRRCLRSVMVPRPSRPPSEKKKPAFHALHAAGSWSCLVAADGG